MTQKHFTHIDRHVLLSPVAWARLKEMMISAQYSEHGGIRLPSNPERDKILELRQFYVDDGHEIEELT